jgi:predicted ThiF/HesA family dinucleotide-utilizing enzyme
MVVLDCGKKRLGLARFVDKQEKHRGGRHAVIAFATSIFQSTVSSR